MKNNVIRLLGLLVTMLSISSCSMEKRLYSSGFHINWRNPSIKHGEPKIANRTKQTLCIKNPYQSTLAADEMTWKVGINYVPRAGSTNVPKLYNSLLPLFRYPTNTTFAHSMVKRPIQTSNKHGVAIPKPRVGETLEQLAKRKAKKALVYGVISFPTSIVIVGFFLAIVSLILGKQARKVAPNDGRIIKRTKASTAWATLGLFIGIFALLYGSLIIYVNYL
jgi:hypothetical protein